MENKKSVEIVRENLIALRKQNKLTQVELSEKIGYSDKTVSRWETGDVVPDIETLDLNTTIEINKSKNFKQRQGYSKLIIVLLCLINVWYISMLIYLKLAQETDARAWLSFVWAIPVSCIFGIAFNVKWGKKWVTITLTSVLCWSICVAFYLQFLSQNVYLIFVAGIPIQIEIILWSYLKSNKNK